MMDAEQGFYYLHKYFAAETFVLIMQIVQGRCAFEVNTL